MSALCHSSILPKTIAKKVSNEGNQNIPPQNVPLGHIDYFELKTIEKRINTKGFSDFSLSI
jgi:hypothetical protein